MELNKTSIFKFFSKILREKYGKFKEMFKAADGDSSLENKDPFQELVHKFAVEKTMSTIVLVNGGILNIDDCILSLK